VHKILQYSEMEKLSGVWYRPSDSNTNVDNKCVKTCIIQKMIRDVSMVLDSVTKVIVSNPRLITLRYFPLMRGEYREALCYSTCEAPPNSPPSRLKEDGSMLNQFQ
jgi:hypothetical protein